MAGFSAQPLCHPQPPSAEGFYGGKRVTLWQRGCPKASPAQVSGERSAARRALFVERSDPIRANPRDEVAHGLEAGQRRRVALDRQQRSPRKTTVPTPTRTDPTAQLLLPS